MTEDSTETKKLLIGIAILVILFVTVFSLRFFLRDTPEELPTYTYNGFEFVKMAGLWHTKWQYENQLYSIHLRYGPRESENISILTTGNNSFTLTDTVYITFDPAGNALAYVALASTELSLSLKNVFGINATGACLRNETYACEKRPIITCDNTDVPVIWVREDNKTGVFIDDNCLIIQGEKEEIVRAADRVIWGWYGIIPK